MMGWLLLFIEFAGGCALLAWGASRLVKGSVAVAEHYRVPPLVVGMVLVGFGTSCPELVVSIFASMKHMSGIAIGNVLGSNIANKALVGGVAAVLLPFTIRSRVLFREFPFLIAMTVLVGVMFYSGNLTRIDGVILIVFFMIYLWWMFHIAKQPAMVGDELIQEMEKEAPAASMPLKKAIVWFIVGLVVLLGGAELIVNAAISIASRLGLSELLIGLTIVAIGTSLPELAATVVSCLRKEYDLAIGNVVGSSLFNLLAVLAMPALIDPGPIMPAIKHRDYPALLLITVMFWLLAVLPKRGHIGRLGGVLLVLAYVSYLAILIGRSFLL